MLTQHALGQMHASIYCTTKYRQDFGNGIHSCTRISSNSKSNLCLSMLAHKHMEQDEQVCGTDAKDVMEEKLVEEAEKTEADTQADEIREDCKVDVEMSDAATQTDLHLTAVRCEWERRYDKRHRREYSCAPLSSIELEHSQTRDGKEMESEKTVTLFAATLSPITCDKAVQTPPLMLLPLVQLKHIYCLNSSSSVGQQESSGVTATVSRLPQLHTIPHPIPDREGGPREATSSCDNSICNTEALLHLRTGTVSQVPLHKTDWQAFKLLARQR